MIPMDRAGTTESLMESNRRLDDYLAIGANALASLREQSSMLKVTLCAVSPRSSFVSVCRS